MDTIPTFSKLTDKLKYSTVIKNNDGVEPAANYIRHLIINEDLKDNDALRATKRLGRFLLKIKGVHVKKVIDELVEIYSNRIGGRENKYDFNFYLTDIYISLKNYQEAFNSIRGALLQIYPDQMVDFHFLLKYRNCYSTMANICLKWGADEKQRAKQFLYHYTASEIFEMISEIMFSNENYFGYKESNFDIDQYPFSTCEMFNDALQKIERLENKKELCEKIKNFVVVDCAKEMGYTDTFINTGNDFNAELYKPFTNLSMVLKFSGHLYT